MKIATWNVNSLKVRLTHVLDWLSTTNCDVLALQELKLDNDNFPLVQLEDLGYYVCYNGQKAYNGVAIISKYPIDEVVYDIPNYQDEQKRVISATIQDIRIICVYVVNGQEVDSIKYQYKLLWLEQLSLYLKASLSTYPKLIVLGDFNIAPKDIDVYDPELFKDRILCSEPERQAFEAMLSLGLSDSFRLFNNSPNEYTWWDYRAFAFRRKLGLRIDHLLISEQVKSLAYDCVIDKEPRKLERPSDHTPIILHLN